MYKSKTKSYAHQIEARKRARNKPAFAYLLEMGTGKSKIVVDETGELAKEDGPIDILIACPNGLQRNWDREYALHCGHPVDVATLSGKMKAGETARFERVLKSKKTRVIICNLESLRKGSKAEVKLRKFLAERRPLYMAVDESHRIKDKGAAQTKAVIRIGTSANWRRILTGTATANSPTDLFTQFYFLDPRILGDSLTVFRAHYCVLLPEKAVRHITGKTNPKIPAAALPQLIQRDLLGRPRYRNLDELAQRIAPHSYRKRKDECLDLPPKVYIMKMVDLSDTQREVYDGIRDEVLMEFKRDGRTIPLDSPLAIVRLGKLAQVSGNHVNDIRLEPTLTNPRIHALRDVLDEAPDAPAIIWARHLAEIEEVVEYIRDVRGLPVARLTGDTKTDKRQEIIDAFQSGGLQYIVGQVAMGIGFNATAAKLVVYYTNSFSLVDRLQSEDRAHRSGLKHSVTYVDLVAQDTIDEKIVEALRAKKSLAEVVAGDPISNWI